MEQVVNQQLEIKELQKIVNARNQERINDLNSFIEKIPITMAEVKENVTELKEYEVKFNKMIKKNENEIKKIDKNKTDADLKFKSNDERLTDLETVMEKIKVEQSYAMARINVFDAANTQEELADENGRALTLRKVNKRISQLKYDLNPEKGKIRGNTFRHPILKKIAELETEI